MPVTWEEWGENSVVTVIQDWRESFQIAKKEKEKEEEEAISHSNKATFHPARSIDDKRQFNLSWVFTLVRQAVLLSIVTT